MISQKGGVFLTLIILIAILGGIYGAYKLSIDSIPGQFLYPVKKELENIRLSTTELSKVKRASVYIDFANERLNELEELEKNGVTTDEIIKILKQVLKNEETALKELKRETARVEDTAQVIQKLKDLRKRQDIIFNRLLDKTKEPEFYEILEVKNKAAEILNEYNLR